MKRLHAILPALCGIAMALTLCAFALDGKKSAAPAPAPQSDSVMSVAPDGLVTISTEKIGADIEGYNGATPLEVSVRDGVIVSVKALENDETPRFFSRVAEELLPLYEGVKVADAVEAEVDAVSGATYSSEAVIENMQRALEYYSAKTK